MLNIEDVKNVFGDVLKISQFVTSDAESFADVFNDANDITYDELVRIDAGLKGYKDFFDKCKAEGILL